MTAPPLLILIRPQHWIKNAFVAAPLFFSPWALTWANLRAVGLGILCFCALASAVYILNDYADRAADRSHPVKCRRPLAAGTVGVGAAFTLLIALVAGGLGLAVWLDPAFAAITAGYFGLNLVYSFALKQVSIIDAVVLALGFVLRVQAGAVLIAVTPTPWILIATFLLALFLALAKRRDDVMHGLTASHRGSLGGYTREFLDVAVTVVLGGLLVAYLIYTTDEKVAERTGTHHLFYTTPFVVAGILRYLQITMVELRSGSPTRIVMTDRFMITTIAGWLLVFGALIHGRF